MAMRGSLLVVAVALAGCGVGSTVGAHHVSTSQHPSTTSQVSPRQQADRDAQELLTHVRVPPSSTATRAAPASRLDAPYEQPEESSLVDRHLFWRVGMTVDATSAWLRAHPPAGLALTQNGNGGGPEYQVIQFAYEPKQPRTDGALRQLQVEVTNLDQASSGIRADALAEWLDPHPIRDTASGRRMHVTTDTRCPASDRGDVGVSDTGADLAKSLLPAATPTSGRVCVYDGLNGHPPFRLAGDRLLTASQAQRMASAARALPLAHRDGGVTNCPSDDASAAVIVLRYPDGRTVDLWAAVSGCAYISNGSIIAAGTLPNLR